MLSAKAPAIGTKTLAVSTQRFIEQYETTSGPEIGEFQTEKTKRHVASQKTQQVETQETETTKQVITKELGETTRTLIKETAKVIKVAAPFGTIGYGGYRLIKEAWGQNTASTVSAPPDQDQQSDKTKGKKKQLLLFLLHLIRLNKKKIGRVEIL